VPPKRLLTETSCKMAGVIALWLAGLPASIYASQSSAA
jgi:hypothetical protein